MKKMKSGKLKARSVMEDVRGSRKDELFGFLAGEVKIMGDIENTSVERARDAGRFFGRLRRRRLLGGLRSRLGLEARTDHSSRG
jgi:hypothetical protein